MVHSIDMVVAARALAELRLFSVFARIQNILNRTSAEVKNPFLTITYYILTEISFVSVNYNDYILYFAVGVLV